MADNGRIITYERRIYDVTNLLVNRALRTKPMAYYSLTSASSASATRRARRCNAEHNIRGVPAAAHTTSNSKR